MAYKCGYSLPLLDDNKSDLPTNIKFAGIYEKIVRKNTSYLN